MKKLSTKERLGAAALAAVSFGFVASAFILRGCSGDVAASSVDSVQDPVAVYSFDSIPGEYEEYEDDVNIREGKKRKNVKRLKNERKTRVANGIMTEVRRQILQVFVIFLKSRYL